jgi:hypothetical protein
MNSISWRPIPRCHYREKVSVCRRRAYMCARIHIIILFLLRAPPPRLEMHTFLFKVNGRRHATHATVFIEIPEALESRKIGSQRVCFCDQTD